MPTRQKKTTKARKAKTRRTVKPMKLTRRSNARVRTRGAEQPPSIVPELMEACEQLLRLMRQTKDPKQLEQLGDQHSVLSEQVEHLIELDIRETTAQYRAAIEGVQEASEAIENAIEGLESVKTVILKAAKAAELAGKVAAMV